MTWEGVFFTFVWRSCCFFSFVGVILAVIQLLKTLCNWISFSDFGNVFFCIVETESYNSVYRMLNQLYWCMMAFSTEAAHRTVCVKVD